MKVFVLNVFSFQKMFEFSFQKIVVLNVVSKLGLAMGQNSSACSKRRDHGCFGGSPSGQQYVRPYVVCSVDPFIHPLIESKGEIANECHKEHDAAIIPRDVAAIDIIAICMDFELWTLSKSAWCL